MILSASRRTDIPAYYSDWFVSRIKEGFVDVKNPFNSRQIRRISLAPEDIDCVVFWTKNPKPLLEKLHSVKNYAYYFQFTLTPYNSDIETNLPPKTELLETFKRLSDTAGAQKIIWRYDPVLLNKKYTVSYHIDTFYEYACKLSGYTQKVTFSFIDFYTKIAKNIKPHGIMEITPEEKHTIAAHFAKSARENSLLIDTCAEDIDLSEYGIKHAKCIDSELIAKITGREFTAKKDKNQR
jgi:hypothetical protein